MRKPKIRLTIEEEEILEEPYEDEYEEPEYDENDEWAEGDIAERLWGLPQGLNLKQQAADQYLLYDLELDGLDEGRHAKHITKLSKLFAPYADMVVGGELRYTIGHVANPSGILPDEMVSALSDVHNENRSTAWEAWYGVRQEHGTDALYWAEDAFKAFGEPATYGGRKWAYIAECLRRYEEREYSALLYVDMCWSLEHNGGQFFGKLWNQHGLKTVLDANQSWNPTALLTYASPEVAQVYTEVRPL